MSRSSVWPPWCYLVTWWTFSNNFIVGLCRCYISKLCYFLVHNTHLSNSSPSFIFLIHQLFKALFLSSCYTSGICPSISFSILNLPNLLNVLPISVGPPRQPENTLSHLTDKSLLIFDWPVLPIPPPYLPLYLSALFSLLSVPLLC